MTRKFKDDGIASVFSLLVTTYLEGISLGPFLKGTIYKHILVLILTIALEIGVMHVTKLRKLRLNKFYQSSKSISVDVKNGSCRIFLWLMTTRLLSLPTVILKLKSFVGNLWGNSAVP